MKKYDAVLLIKKNHSLFNAPIINVVIAIGDIGFDNIFGRHMFILYKVAPYIKVQP
jgi:hypothetical protein